MQISTAQLKKLRRMARGEILARVRQEMAKARERFLGLSVGEPSDAVFMRSLNRANRGSSALEASAGIATRIHESSGHAFFPSLGCRGEIASLMRGRFSAAADALTKRARRAVSGRFDLLGFDDIHFDGEIEWRIEPVSGLETGLAHWSLIDYLDVRIAGDKKITWELNRHGHFVTLGQAYWITGDECFARAFVAQASSWMDSNPPNLGINWASSLECALRSVAWLWSFHLFAGSPHLTAEFKLRFLKCLLAHGRHIKRYLSDYFSPNTHLTGEALGLFYLGIALPELREAETWRATGARILLEQLPRQVREDGVYFEQASYYHRYTTDFYVHLVVLARAAGIELPPVVEEKLTQLLDHLMWITRPDGSSTLVGDDDGGRLLTLGERSHDDFRDTLAVGAALFGRGDWKWVAGDAPAEMLWLLGPRALADYDCLPSTRPESRSRAFEESGFYVIRDNWSEQSHYALIDCGPHGALACGHSHADALAFEYAALGKTWFVDPGTLTYTGNSESRDRFRTSAAHNTVIVDGQSQSVPDGPFSWKNVARSKQIDFVSSDQLVYFKGAHDGYERLRDPVTHTRSLVFVRPDGDSQGESQPGSYLLVRDTMASNRRHHYAIRYHLAPGCTAIANGNRIVVADHEWRRLGISTFGDPAPQARIGQASVSRSYGRQEAALVADFEAEASGDRDFFTCVLPTARGQVARVEELKIEASAARAFQVSCGSTLDLIVMNDADEVCKCGPATVTASVGWVRFVDDRLVKACLIGGRQLESGDGFSFSASVTLSSASIRRTDDRVEICIETGDRIAAFSGAATVRVNDAEFRLTGERQTIVIANDGSGWRMTNAG